MISLIFSLNQINILKCCYLNSSYTQEKSAHKKYSTAVSSRLIFNCLVMLLMYKVNVAVFFRMNLMVRDPSDTNSLVIIDFESAKHPQYHFQKGG